MIRISIGILLSFIANFGVKAQSISGHFVIQSKEIINGKEYLNAIAKEITVIHTKDSLMITRVIPAVDNQATTTTESIPLNGKAVVTTTTSNRKKTAALTFSKDSREVTIIYILSFANKPEEVEFRNTEVWTMNSDGTLTIVKTADATVTDDWTIKAVFSK